MKIEKYGAIDIGSNAIRLLISNCVYIKGQHPHIIKNSITRIPIRVGSESFTQTKIISKVLIEELVKAMIAFKIIMEVYKVKEYRACATSALREAINKKEVVEKVKEETGIGIDIIDGKEEARIISTINIYKNIKDVKHNHFLYVDVGGGSTELSVLIDGKKTHSKSFKLGTVRILNTKDKKVLEETWNEMKKWVKVHTKGIKNLKLIGSGGNINKLFKLANIKYGKPLKYSSLDKKYRILKNLSFEERMVLFNLNADRADVIIPAAKIYLKVLKWTGARKVFVPKMGLGDGIIKMLIDKENNTIRA